MKQTHRRKLQVTLVGLLIAAFEFYYNGFGTLAFNVAGFGTEYGNTAASVVNGTGYSNPFGFATGPSSWVPPGVVSIYALIFKFFGVRTYAAGLALLALRAAVLTAAIWCLTEAARLLVPEGPKVTALITISAIGLFGHFNWLTQRCTDQWVIILVSALAILCLEQIQTGPVRPWQMLFAFLLPVTVPAVGLGFGIVLCWQALRRSRVSLSLLLAFMLSVGCWSVRNLATMGAPFLIKSNLGFEFFLSNPCSETGLLETEVHFANHPLYPQNRSSQEIRRLGEAEFCRVYRRRAIEFIQENPQVFLGRVSKRAANALLYCRFSGSSILEQRVRGLAYALFPTVLLVFGLFRGGWRVPTFRNAVVLYLAFLFPYILVSHAERYQLGAIGLQVWIVWVTLFSGLLARSRRDGAADKVGA
jgi:hypothetical protein